MLCKARWLHDARTCWRIINGQWFWHGHAAVGITSKWHFVAISVLAIEPQRHGVSPASILGKEWPKKCAHSVIYRDGIWLKSSACDCNHHSWFSVFKQCCKPAIKQWLNFSAFLRWYGFPVLLLTHIVVVAVNVRSSGDTVAPLLLGGVTIALNIALNFILIKGVSRHSSNGRCGCGIGDNLGAIDSSGLDVWLAIMRKHWLLTTPSSPIVPSLWLSYRRIALPLTMNAVLWAMGTIGIPNDLRSHGPQQSWRFSRCSRRSNRCVTQYFWYFGGGVFSIGSPHSAVISWWRNEHGSDVHKGCDWVWRGCRPSSLP